MVALLVGYKRQRVDEPCFTPTKREEDADFDLRASVPVVIQPGQIGQVPTNLILDFPPGWEGKIEDKSGLARDKGVHVVGGVIDCGYTGEIVVLITNLGKTNIVFDVGNKVAQIKFRPATPPIVFEMRDMVKSSERGGQGFGSTGV